MKTAEILIDALNYIRQFKGEIFVIKVGGEAIPDKKVIESIADDLIFLSAVGIHPVLVHGGGKGISDAMQKRGLKPKFIGGLRVTDEETIQIVKKELARMNKQIVKTIEREGGKAVGVPGNRAFYATKINPELGYVGKVKSVRRKQITKITDRGGIPVVYPLGGGKEGETLNINADTAASELAVKLKASKFIVLTNVTGVLDAEGNKINALDIKGARKLMKKGVISGGMIPKLEACIRALRRSVGKAHIVKATKHAILEEILTVEGTGTMITK